LENHYSNSQRAQLQYIVSEAIQLPPHDKIHLENEKKYIDCMRNEKDFMRDGLFVCDGDPFLRNVIWRDKNAVIKYFENSKA